MKKKKRILLVDDESDITAALRRIKEALGFRRKGGKESERGLLITLGEPLYNKFNDCRYRLVFDLKPQTL